MPIRAYDCVACGNVWVADEDGSTCPKCKSPVDGVSGVSKKTNDTLIEGLAEQAMQINSNMNGLYAKIRSLLERLETIERKNLKHQQVQTKREAECDKKELSRDQLFKSLQDYKKSVHESTLELRNEMLRSMRDVKKFKAKFDVMDNNVQSAVQDIRREIEQALDQIRAEIADDKMTILAEAKRLASGRKRKS